MLSKKFEWFLLKINQRDTTNESFWGFMRRQGQFVKQGHSARSSYAITLLVVSYLRVLESTATEKENAALADLDGVALGHAFIGFVKYFASTGHVFTLRW